MLKALMLHGYDPEAGLMPVEGDKLGLLVKISAQLCSICRTPLS